MRCIFSFYVHPSQVVFSSGGRGIGKDGGESNEDTAMSSFEANSDGDIKVDSIDEKLVAIGTTSVLTSLNSCVR
jgi:hypothetical protein